MNGCKGKSRTRKIDIMHVVPTWVHMHAGTHSRILPASFHMPSKHFSRLEYMFSKQILKRPKTHGTVCPIGFNPISREVLSPDGFASPSQAPVQILNRSPSLRWTERTIRFGTYFVYVIRQMGACKKVLLTLLIYTCTCARSTVAGCSLYPVF